MRSEVATHRGGRRLVEKGQPLVDLACLDVRPPFAREREHLDVAIADTRGQLVHAVEELHRFLQLPAEQRHHGLNHCEPGVLGCFGQPFEQPLGIREPATRDRERAPTVVIPAHGQRHACRAERVAVGGVGGVRALAVCDRLVELPAPPRRLAVALEVPGGQSLRVDLGVRRVGGAPRLPRGGGACVVERVDHL